MIKPNWKKLGVMIASFSFLTFLTAFLATAAIPKPIELPANTCDVNPSLPGC